MGWQYMALVAQWQSTALWRRVLPVRPRSSAPESQDTNRTPPVESDRKLNEYGGKSYLTRFSIHDTLRQ
jgi:hypothetical protein